MHEERFGDNFYNTLITIKDDSFIFAEPVTCLTILNDLGFITEETYTNIGLFPEKVNGTSLAENEKRPNYEEVIGFIYDNLLSDSLLSGKLAADVTEKVCGDSNLKRGVHIGKAPSLSKDSFICFKNLSAIGEKL